MRFIGGLNRAFHVEAKLLCLQCSSIKRPLHQTVGRVCCPDCKASDPVSLDSDEAEDYFCRRGWSR